MSRLRGRRRAGELGRCNFALQTVIPIIIQLGEEWFNKCDHCLCKDSYLTSFLGLPLRFPPVDGGAVAFCEGEKKKLMR